LLFFENCHASFVRHRGFQEWILQLTLLFTIPVECHVLKQSKEQKKTKVDTIQIFLPACLQKLFGDKELTAF
jgi:hypothetical protein